MILGVEGEQLVGGPFWQVVDGRKNILEVGEGVGVHAKSLHLLIRLTIRKQALDHLHQLFKREKDALQKCLLDLPKPNYTKN
jgi:hypothetical protein